MDHPHDLDTVSDCALQYQVASAWQIAKIAGNVRSGNPREGTLVAKERLALYRDLLAESSASARPKVGRIAVCSVMSTSFTFPHLNEA